MEIRLKKTLDEFELAREKAREIKDKFQMIRQKRIHSFQMAFDHIAKMIDEIYKELTKTETHPLGGTAFLTLENSEVCLIYSFSFLNFVVGAVFRWREISCNASNETFQRHGTVIGRRKNGRCLGFALRNS